jgi:hypothetical protein
MQRHPSKQVSAIKLGQRQLGLRDRGGRVRDRHQRPFDDKSTVRQQGTETGEGIAQTLIIVRQQAGLGPADVELRGEDVEKCARLGSQFGHEKQVDEGLTVLAEIDDRSAHIGPTVLGQKLANLTSGFIVPALTLKKSAIPTDDFDAAITRQLMKAMVGEP